MSDHRHAGLKPESTQMFTPTWHVFLNLIQSNPGSTRSATERGTASGTIRHAPPATQWLTTWSPTLLTSLGSNQTRMIAAACGASLLFTTPTWEVRTPHSSFFVFKLVTCNHMEPLSTLTFNTMGSRNTGKQCYYTWSGLKQGHSKQQHWRLADKNIPCSFSNVLLK